MMQRPGEKIGGGWFLFTRRKRDGRLLVGESPFEFPTFEAAEAERARLAEVSPDASLQVFVGMPCDLFPDLPTEQAPDRTARLAGVLALSVLAHIGCMVALVFFAWPR